MELTKAEWEATEYVGSLPTDLQEYIFNNSDGEMLDDNWNEYIEYTLNSWFDSTDEPYVYSDLR